jgi:hypothetical protein
MTNNISDGILASMFMVEEQSKQETGCKLVTCFAYSLSLMMEATGSSQTSVDFHGALKLYIPKLFITSAART